LTAHRLHQWLTIVVGIAPFTAKHKQD